MRQEATDDLPFDPDLADRPAAPVRRPRQRRSWRGAARLAAISAGGALGGAARYGVEFAMPASTGAFPWGTFAVNVAGSFTLALLLVVILEVWSPRRYLRPFAAIGFLGSFTTFSTWMLEVHDLISDGRASIAALYLVSSLAGGLAATSLGLVIGRALAQSRTHARYRVEEAR